MNLKQNISVISADLETPVGLYLKIRDLYPCSALLESSDYHTSQNSVSLIGVDPIGSFTVVNEEIICRYPNGEESRIPAQDVTSALRDYISSYSNELNDPKIFNGLFGFTAYDAVRYFEPSVPIQPREEKFADIPDMQYLLYRFVIQVNHFRNEMTIIENIPEGESSKTEELISIIRNNNIAIYPFKAADDLESTVSDEEFEAMVAKGIAHQYCPK